MAKTIKNVMVSTAKVEIAALLFVNAQMMIPGQQMLEDKGHM